ncbi:MAG: MATE family efflux transporter [Victivallaceae bacterium]|nr:MATE family efflux transporter [Victivallaceae bacterium]
MERQIKMVDMTEGALFGKILVFFFPLALSYILQLLFNAADLIVVGRCSSPESLAAVGATNTLTALLINVFIGFSISANVLVAQYFGAKDFRRCARAVHASIGVAVAGGVFLGILGIALANFLLDISGVPPEIFERARIYLIIVFGATPFIAVYNFGSGILRAVGDTRKPFYYLTISGILNVVLNVIFVVFCRLDVAGVALGTLISQGVAAFLVFRALVLARVPITLRLKLIHFDREMLKKIFQIGIPAGFQSSCYAISNAVIQSTVNSFGTAAIAGSTAAASIEGIVYINSWAFHQTVLTFVGQNFGAKKFDRILRSLRICLADCAVILLAAGMIALFFRTELLSIFTDKAPIIDYGAARLVILCSTYFIIGVSDTATGAIRAFGKTLEPAILVFVCVCLFRIAWIETLMTRWHDWDLLFWSYPVSWALSAGCSILMFHFYLRKFKREAPAA